MWYSNSLRVEFLMQVVASKVCPTIQMLLSEADGMLSREMTKDQLQQATNVVGVLKLPMQIWLDKDGRVSFIKLKIADPTYMIFERGESRVAYLLEFIGDEGECRRFMPPLVDQFAASNQQLFTLTNQLQVRVVLTYLSGDHKAMWAQTGRTGGIELRDLFCHFSLASRYHKVLYQGPVTFRYSEYVTLWKTINDKMEVYRNSLTAQLKPMTKKMEKEKLDHLYRQHGRIDKVPAFANGTKQAQPNCSDQLLNVPLNLHNDTYANLLTMDLMFQIVDKKSTQLKKLQGRWKGLVDGFGQTKCSTSGEGIRRLFNDCLQYLEESMIPSAQQKYSPVWWLKDAISYHLRLKIHRDHQPMALEDHERLKFAASTMLWWLLIGDLSDLKGTANVVSIVRILEMVWNVRA